MNPFAEAGLTYAETGGPDARMHVIHRGARRPVPPWTLNDKQTQQVIAAYLGRYVGETNPAPGLAALRDLEARVLKSPLWNNANPKNRKHKEFIERLGGSPATFYGALIYRFYRLRRHAADILAELQELTEMPCGIGRHLALMNRLARKILPAEDCLPLIVRDPKQYRRARRDHDGFNMWQVIFLRSAGLSFQQIAPIVGTTATHIYVSLAAIGLTVARGKSRPLMRRPCKQPRKRRSDYGKPRAITATG